MSAPPLLFKNKEVRVELTEHSLPAPPIQWGGRQRNTITRYSDDWVTVQSHGVEYQDIEIKGRLQDIYLGSGGAQWIRSQLEKLMLSRDVVAFEYDKERRWGLFEVTFYETHRELLEYRIRFKPLWLQDPNYLPPTPFVDSPATSAAKIDALSQKTQQLMQHPPADVNTWHHDVVSLSKLHGHGVIATARFTNALSKIHNLATLPFAKLESLQALANNALFTTKQVSQTLNAINPDHFSSKKNITRLDSYRWLLLVQKEQRLLQYEQYKVKQRISDKITPLIVRQYVVRPGDSLVKIAQQTLGDFTRWDEIADANNIKQGFVTPGMVLNIPR